MSVRRLAAVGALALIVGLTVCPTATGAVLGLAPLEFSTPLGSPTFQGEPVNCLGHRVIGGGGQLSGGSGEARLKQVLPSPDLTEVTVQGCEDANGFTGQWSASTIAICAMPPPGLQRVAATSPRNSANKSVTASCPSGKRVLGTGGAVVGGGAGSDSPRLEARRRERHRAGPGGRGWRGGQLAGEGDRGLRQPGLRARACGRHQRYRLERQARDRSLLARQAGARRRRRDRRRWRRANRP